MSAPSSQGEPISLIILSFSVFVMALALGLTMIHLAKNGPVMSQAHPAPHYIYSAPGQDYESHWYANPGFHDTPEQTRPHPTTIDSGIRI